MVSAALSNTNFSLGSSTSKVHIPKFKIKGGEGQPLVVNKSELCIVSVVEHTHNTTNVFKRDCEVTTDLNQPIPVVDNSIPVDTVEDVICSPPKKRRKRFNEESIIMGKQLTDLEIDYAQRLLVTISPSEWTSTKIVAEQVNENKIQIVFATIDNITQQLTVMMEKSRFMTPFLATLIKSCCVL